MKQKKVILDQQEREWERELERGEYVRVEKSESKKMWQEAVKNYRELGQTKRITIRVNNADLIKVKTRAKKSKIPYQTLIKTLIGQFADGQISMRM